MRKLLLALLFASLTPAPLLACLCEYVSVGGEPPRIRPWKTYPRIFIGHAIEVDNPGLGAVITRVKFVTEASWTGAMADTVTVRVGPNAPCARFVANGRYLVVADTVRGGHGLVLAQCEDGWALNHPVAHRRREELVEPTWTAPPMGRRALDAGVVRLGEPINRGSPAETIPLMIPNNGFITRFEIGDYPDSHRGIGQRRIAPGLYQYRVWFTDGTSYSSYMSARCESTIGEEKLCYMFRYYGSLRETREASPNAPPEAMPGDPVCDSAVARSYSASGDALHAAILGLESCARGPRTLAWLWYQPRPDTIALRVLAAVSSRVRDVRVMSQLTEAASDMWKPAHVRLAAISALVALHVPCTTVMFRDGPAPAGTRVRPELYRMSDCSPEEGTVGIRIETPRATLVDFLRRLAGDRDTQVSGVAADLARLLAGPGLSQRDEEGARR